jgi:6,7-dimethyl-8-ribityllumazine synthase
MATRIHIIAGYIHKDISDMMVEAAREQANALGVEIGRVVWIPGSLEAPLTVQEIIDTDRPDGIVVFGVQEQGETKHGEVIAHQATSKLLDLQLAHKIPMAVSIIGPGTTLEHATNKAERTAKKAIMAVHHMMKLLNDLDTKPL